MSGKMGYGQDTSQDASFFTWRWLMGLLLMFVMIGVIVMIHESGHYLMMVRNGVPVEEFTVGFGPTLFQRQLKNGTWFRLKLILLGGYAKPANNGLELEAAHWWARLKIYAGGMIANCLAAGVALTVLFFHQVSVQGGGPKIYAYALLMAFVKPFMYWLSTPLVLAKLLIFSPKVVASGVQGPVGIIAAGTVINMSQGLWGFMAHFVNMFVMINVGLAGFNLVPIPGLDGGRIAMMPFEKLLGKKWSQILTMAGFLLLLTVMILVTSKDIAGLLSSH